VQFCNRIHYRGPVTVGLAIQWANDTRSHTTTTTTGAARRLEVLRPFAAYCRQFDAATEVPPRGLLGTSHSRLAPHIFTGQEITALLAACHELRPAGGMRGASCEAIFGLMASTGLRISEAAKLTLADVDLDAQRLFIREGKCRKSRWVPLHPTTVEALRAYARRRTQHPFAGRSEAFFIFDKGHPVSIEAIRRAFCVLRAKLQWRARGDHPRPRCHDLRHSFICHRLEDWYSQGAQIDRHILSLSTYVGHSRVTDTYWYITATPELLAIAARRFECARRPVS
jgi:integrase